MTQFTPAQLTTILGLVEASNLPQEERNALLSAIIQARKPALQFRPVGGAHLTNGGLWSYAHPGRDALQMAANSPGMWVDLAPNRSHSGWSNMIGRAVESLRKVDPDLAKVLDTTSKPNAPGTHLRTVGDRVQVMWRPGPGVAVEVDVKAA